MLLSSLNAKSNSDSLLPIARDSGSCVIMPRDAMERDRGRAQYGVRISDASRNNFGGASKDNTIHKLTWHLSRDPRVTLTADESRTVTRHDIVYNPTS